MIRDTAGGALDAREDMKLQDRMIFDAIFSALEGEQSDSPITVLQKTIVERAVVFYLKMREFDSQTGLSRDQLAELKFYAETWIKCIGEYNRIIARGQSGEQRRQFVEKVMSAVKAAIVSVPDEKLRTQLASGIADEFEKVGL
jgi:hypothetical protein